MRPVSNRRVWFIAVAGVALFLLGVFGLLAYIVWWL
jgi:phage shock protein PspC (stress-responsive transcriptional regulator)